MNAKEFSEVTKLSGSKRYEYFLKKVADDEELWGLYNDGWAMVADDEENEMIPFWPKKEFADACCNEHWKNYISEPIGLTEFMESWIDNLKNNGLSTAIFIVKDDKGIIVKPEKLLEDLKEELSNY